MYPTVPTLPLIVSPSGICTARPKSEMRMCPKEDGDIYSILQQSRISQNYDNRSINYNPYDSTQILEAKHSEGANYEDMTS